MTRTFVATSTENFQLLGLKVLAVADSADEAERMALESILGDDIYAQTLRANLRVRSLSALKRAPRGAQAWRNYVESE